DTVAPVLPQLRRTDDERLPPLVERVLLDEGEPDLGLASADAVGIDHALVLRKDSARTLVSVPLEARELHARDLLLLDAPYFVARELEQRAQIHRRRVDQPDCGEEQVAELVVERRGSLPELVEPADR